MKNLQVVMHGHYLEKGEENMLDMKYVSKGTFVATESEFVKFYGMLHEHSFVFEDDLIQLTYVEESKYRFVVQSNSKNDFMDVLSLLNKYVRLVEFDGHEFDDENMRNSEVYKLEDGDIVIYTEDLRQEYLEDADFYLFRELFFLQDELRVNFTTSFSVESTKLYYQLKETLNKHEKQDTFISAVTSYINKEVLNEKFEISLLDEFDNQFIDLKIYFSNNEIKFFVNCMLGEFKKSNQGISFRELREPAESELIDVKLGVFEDVWLEGQLSATTVSEFLIEEDIQIQKKLDEDWINPCKVCGNRLLQVSYGCLPCKFIHVDEILENNTMLYK